MYYRGIARIFQRGRGGSYCVKQRILTRLLYRPPRRVLLYLTFTDEQKSGILNNGICGYPRITDASHPLVLSSIPFQTKVNPIVCMTSISTNSKKIALIHSFLKWQLIKLQFAHGSKCFLFNNNIPLVMKFAKIRISLTTKPIAYIYPYPPPKVKRKRGKVYDNLTLIVFCDVTLIYAKLCSLIICGTCQRDHWRCLIY